MHKKEKRGKTNNTKLGHIENTQYAKSCESKESSTN